MLLAIVRHRQFDVVLIDTYSTSAFWFAWCSAKLCQALDLKYIMILHGGNLPLRLKSHPKQCKAIFKKAFVNITPSPYLFEEFQKADYSNLKMIPNHIDIKNYAFKSRKIIQPKLLWVRAFAEIYNPLMALKVLKLLRNDYPQATLSMVGPFKDNSITQCKNYALEHDLPVKFTGKMTKKKWIDYAKDFDIFINTTDVDNTPVSVIEAMALGLPVVSTNVGGLPYLLKHEEQALLVNPNDEKAMNRKILNLLQNENLLEKLSYNGRQLAETFDWNVVKSGWQEVLN
jgi:glycosyltransferase involved in cell wall biosynthesis